MLLKNNTLFGLPTQMVMDPVHGGIHFFSHEQLVIDHPLFQRLRFILQNDILNLVFPGSQHTRFQHSIGTMHLAGKFLQSLVKSYLIQFKKQEYLSSELVGSINYLHGCLRLAALLHDTGHAPFSHQFEHSEQISSLLNNELFIDLWKDENYKLYFESIPTKVEHEHYSIRITHEIFKTIPEFGISANDVIFFMEKSENKPSTLLISHISNLIATFVKNITPLARVANEKFLFRLIAITNAPFKLLTELKTIISGEIDVDKMDYILRDSYFSGSKYGNYNIDSILNSLRIGYKYNGYKRRNSTWIGIAIDPKGLRAIEDFIYSRFQLYLELYNHKTVCGFKFLLSKAIDESLSKPENFDFVKECLSDVNKYWLLTDSYLWEDFKKTALTNSKSACFSLVNRKKLKFIYKEKNRSPSQIQEKIYDLEKSTGRKICYWQSPVKFSKINDFFDKIRVLRKKPNGIKELVEIKDVTDFFSLFREKIELVYYFEIRT